MKNKKYRLFRSFIYYLSSPCPPPPPPNPNCERVTNEFAGNFLITNNTIPSTKDASQSMILWQSDGYYLYQVLFRFTIVLAAQNQLQFKSLEPQPIFSLCFLVIQYRTQEKLTVSQYYQYNK